MALVPEEEAFMMLGGIDRSPHRCGSTRLLPGRLLAGELRAVTGK